MEYLKCFLSAFQGNAVLIGSIATLVIAYYSYVSSKMSKEMREISNKMEKISQRSLELSRTINEQNNIQRHKTNRLFWALVFSNMLTIENRKHRQDRLGFILKVFGTDNVLSESNINAIDLLNAANASCDKFFTDEINKAINNNK